MLLRMDLYTKFGCSIALVLLYFSVFKARERPPIDSAVIGDSLPCQRVMGKSDRCLELTSLHLSIKTSTIVHPVIFLYSFKAWQ